MHSYKVRPGYGSDKLLIEFSSDSSDNKFVADLRTVLRGAGLVSHSKEDHIFNFIAHFESPVGPFDIDNDEWGYVWIYADANQDAIHFMDHLLQRSGLFKKEEVDYKEYELQ